MTIYEQLIDWLQSPPQMTHIGKRIHDLSSKRAYRVHGQWSVNLYDYHASVLLNGRRAEIRPGFACLMPPDTHRVFDFIGPSPHRAAHFVAPEIPGFDPVMFDAGRRFERLCRRHDEARACWGEQVQRANALYWTLLWELPELPEASAGPSTREHPLLSRALAVIEENLQHRILVSEIADELGITHTHLARLFRQRLNTSAITYIRKRRADIARHLLRFTDIPIKAVAADVGIPDLQRFNKLIHRECGCAPSVIRKQSH